MTGSDLTAILVAPSGLDHLGGVDPRLAKPRLGLNSGRCSAACRILFSRGEEVNLPNTNHSIDAWRAQALQFARIQSVFRNSTARMIRLRSIATAVALASLTLVCAAAAQAQQRPLLTEDVDIIPPGSMRIQAGVDFVQRARYPVSGLSGDLTRAGVIGITIGFAPNVEFQIEGVAQNFLSINDRGLSAIPLNLAAGANSTHDTGDFTLWAKIKLRNETRNWPSFGFRFGVQLPNSNQSTGIGLNQTNAFGQVLVGKKFGRNARVNLFGNLGVGILAAPTQNFTQNDVLTYGFAGIVRIDKTFSLVAEVNGRANTRPGTGPLGTESQGEARLGMQVRASGMRFDFAGIKGLTKFSPRSGVTVGVTYDTPSIFTPAK